MFGTKPIVLVLIMALNFLTNAETDVKDWYRTTTIYEIYPRSFKDSDGDGVGDIKGIFEKLDYLHNIGVETLWIQPIYKSPMVDFGYDISDFTDIDPMFGTLEDFKQLVKAVHARGMKVIMDFVPNHTSDRSPWFEKSVKREAPYTDFYVWRDPAGYDPDKNKYIPPNNWLSVFSGSAWEWNESRKQFYLHQFSSSQPDLDFRNPKVRAVMEDVIRFWLDLGLDGFRVDAIAHLVEDSLFRDNPWVSPEKTGSLNYYDQIRTYSEDQDETYEITHQWRMLLDEYKAKDGNARILTVETYQPIQKMKRFYGNETYENIHFPISAFYPGLLSSTTVSLLDQNIRAFIEGVPATASPSWAMSNHDVSRVTSRITPDFSESALMIELLLPGVAIIYYGEEIRMQDFNIRPDRIRDPNYKEGLSIYLRDKARTPMQWDDSNNAGFTTKKESWLPVNTEYWRNNVKMQQEDPRSHLNIFKRLMELRKTSVIQNGELNTCVISQWLYLFERKLVGEQSVFVVSNLGTESESMCIKNCAIELQRVMQVHTASLNSGYDTGDVFVVEESKETPCSILRPNSGLVLTTVVNSQNNGVHLSQSFSKVLFLLSTTIFIQSLFLS